LSTRTEEEKILRRPEQTAYDYLKNNYFASKPSKSTLCEKFRVFPLVVAKYNKVRGTKITVISE